MNRAGLQQELEHLSELLKRAAGSVRQIARLLEDTNSEMTLETPKSVSESSVIHPPEDERPIPEPDIEVISVPKPPSLHDIERLVPVAASILRDEPDRIWRDWELIRAVFEVAEDARVNWSKELITGLIRKVLLRGFLSKVASDRYRAVVDIADEVEEEECGWVNPLHREWTTNWSTYIAVQRGRLTDLPPMLTPEQEAEFCIAELEGLSLCLPEPGLQSNTRHPRNTWAASGKDRGRVGCRGS